MVAAVGTTTANPIKADRKTTYVSHPEANVDKRVAASEKQLKALEDIKLFDLKADTFAKTATATATKAPVSEPAKAQAIASTPVFDFGKGVEHITSMIAMFNPAGIATAGGLKKPEGNSGSGDKKDGQNAFVAWHKGLEELREEKLLGTDNSFNVMA
jgi:hypothetical protein